jgi:fumarate reductase flavoprotein subunit
MVPRVVAAASQLADAPHVPVAIIGAGACGLVAALHLRDAGIDCVLLERDAQPQGSTALSSGFIPAAETAVQRAAGVVDSAQQFGEDIQRKAGGMAAPHLVVAYTAAIAPAMDNLVRHGLAFELLDGFLYPGHSVRRMHALRERTGASLITQLDRAAMRAGATLLQRAHVQELLTQGRRVSGVGYSLPDGSWHYLGCDQLILACNGYGGNAELVHRYLPEISHAVFAGHTGNDGSAVRWGEQLGARVADMRGYQGHGSWAVPHGALVTWAVMMEGGIQVNANGQRFHDETQGYSEAAVHVLAQPDGVAYNVFDAPLLQLARRFPDFCAAEAAGAVKCFPTIEAMAEWMGCDVNRLWATCTEPHQAPSKGDAAKRIFRRLLTGPWYVIKVTGALFHTQGGLDIDAHCRVLDQQGQPFPNLLAAGGAARGVSGNAVWGYLSGNGLLSAVAGGAIAARTARAALEKA